MSDHVHIDLVAKHVRCEHCGDFGTITTPATEDMVRRWAFYFASDHANCKAPDEKPAKKKAKVR